MRVAAGICSCRQLSFGNTLDLGRANDLLHLLRRTPNSLRRDGRLEQAPPAVGVVADGGDEHPERRPIRGLIGDDDQLVEARVTTVEGWERPASHGDETWS